MYRDLRTDRIRLHKAIFAGLEIDAAFAQHGHELEAIMVHPAIEAREWARAAELAAASRPNISRLVNYNKVNRISQPIEERLCLLQVRGA